MVSTADFITPPVNDPFVYGQIAAANAISDVYAMGGRPITCLNLVAFPSGKLPPEVLHRIALVQCVPNYRDPERSDWEAIEELTEALPAEDAQLFYQIAIKGRDELYLAPDPRTGLEMTLLRMLAFRPASVEQPVTARGAPPAPSSPRRRARASSGSPPITRWRRRWRRTAL